MQPEDVKEFNDVQTELKELGLKADPVETKAEETTTPEAEEAPKEVESEEVETETEVRTEETVDEETEKPEQVFNRKKFDYKDYKQTLREELQADFDKKLEKMREEMSKSKPDDAKTEDLEEDIKRLADELNFDVDKTRKIVETARKGLEVNPEERKLLEETKTFLEQEKQKAFLSEQKQIFDEEFNSVLPELKKQFPNASDEQINLAKAELDKLSHTEKYHTTELDYIVFKEKDLLGKVLFSPKQKTFESSRPFHQEPEEEYTRKSHDEIVNMTPAQFEAHERRMNRLADESPKEKTRITTYDDSGRLIEIWE